MTNEDRNVASIIPDATETRNYIRGEIRRYAEDHKLDTSSEKVEEVLNYLYQIYDISIMDSKALDDFVDFSAIENAFEDLG